MINYEMLLFDVAPWTREVLEISKSLNNKSFMRGRTGWIKKNIDNPESIYEHSCKVALAAHYLFNSEEAIAQGVIHDFPEIYEPDYLPGEISKEVKKANEYEAMKKISKFLPDGNWWLHTWERNANKEGVGKQLFELDKICPVIQAIDYEKTYKNNNLEEFYPYARKQIETPALINLLDSVYQDEKVHSESAYQRYFEGLQSIRTNNLIK